MTGRRASIAAIAAATVAWAGSAAAQTYPDRIIEMIVPSTPGSSADILGRILGESMGAQLGQRFVVLNKAGGSGILGTAEAARAKPDGYTLMHGAAFSVTVQPLTERQNSYKTVADLIAAAKAKNGGLNYGSPGLGTIPHLSMAELSQISKTEFNHVPFKGPAEAIQMAHAGQIEFSVVPLTAAANSGLVMPGLFAEKRNSSIPDVPTVKEQGFDVAPLSIGGLLAPKGLPADIKKKLEAACITAKESEPFQRIVKSTFQPSDYFADSAGFAANLSKDVADKRRLLTALGMVKN